MKDRLEQVRNALLVERERLISDHAPPIHIPFLGANRFEGYCASKSDEVLKKICNVLAIMNDVSRRDWPTEEQWAQILPLWFVEHCISQSELENLSSHDPELKQKIGFEAWAKLAQDRAWTLQGWTHWFKMENRNWFWWDGIVINDGHFRIAVFIVDWPTPLGALKWLAKTAGATDLEQDED